MADGIFPGPKGLRERVLSAWRRSSALPVEPDSEVASVRYESPAPALRPPGMGAPRHMVWPTPSNDRERASSTEKPSYIEDLKARVRGEQREGPSLLRRDFNRERD